MNDEVNSKQTIFTLQEIQAMADNMMKSFGAPNQMYMDPQTLRALKNYVLGTEAKSVHFMRARDRLHGGLKVGTITWQQSDIIEGAAEAFERMGFFRHVPKD